MPEVWWSLANMHDGLIPKHLRVGGQQEEEETARHFNKSPLPSKHLPVFSIPAFKLPIPLPLHSLHPHPFPPIFSPYPHPTRTFPHKVLVLRSACRSNVSDDTDASSTPTWCNKPDDVLCQQLSTRSTHAKGKRGKGRGKREEEELKEHVCQGLQLFSLTGYAYSVLPQRSPEITSKQWVVWRILQNWQGCAID